MLQPPCLPNYGNKQAEKVEGVDWCMLFHETYHSRPTYARKKRSNEILSHQIEFLARLISFRCRCRAAPAQNEFQNAFGFSFTLRTTLNQDNTGVIKYSQRKYFNYQTWHIKSITFNLKAKGRNNIILDGLYTKQSKVCISIQKLL